PGGQSTAPPSPPARPSSSTTSLRWRAAPRLGCRSSTSAPPPAARGQPAIGASGRPGCRRSPAWSGPRLWVGGSIISPAVGPQGWPSGGDEELFDRAEPRHQAVPPRDVIGRIGGDAVELGRPVSGRLIGGPRARALPQLFHERGLAF